MTIPHPFPYQGSKRKLANTIIQYIPPQTTRIVEPFAGSGALSIAAIYHQKVQSALINDINQPLMALWEYIVHNPDQLADEYESMWHQQLGQEKAYYNFIRDKFNQTQKPQYLLFLLVRCVKASVRYNANGFFNQSPDNRRKGTRPATMRKQLKQTALLMAGKTHIKANHYHAILDNLSPTDIVYLDPPYQGVTKSKDPRYYGNVSFNPFVEMLDNLNQRNIRYIVSYDGRTGKKKYGNPLPKSLNLIHLEIDAGRSSQETLLGRTNRTYESLYLSPNLALDIQGKA